MALDVTNFSRVATGPVSMFTYKTTDAIATVIAADYFLNTDIQPQITENDIIIAVTSTGGTDAVDVLVVTASTTATVTVTNGT